MVKESERKKTYHPRSAHKEGCMCKVCKTKRTKLEALPLVEPEIVAPSPLPAEVRIDTLAVKDKFEIEGKPYLVKDKVEGMVVCCNLLSNDTATLGGSTMVKLIK